MAYKYEQAVPFKYKQYIKLKSVDFTDEIRTNFNNFYQYIVSLPKDEHLDENGKLKKDRIISDVFEEYKIIRNQSIDEIRVAVADVNELIEGYKNAESVLVEPQLIKVDEFMGGMPPKSEDENISWNMEYLANRIKVNKDKWGKLALESLQETFLRLSKRLDKLIDMRADGEISEEKYFERKTSAEEEMAQVNRLINNKKLEMAEQKKFKMDIEKIRERLRTYVDTTGYGVSNEMIEFFVERIIRRANDEYVWEMNLSGLTPKPNKYKIKGYSKEYAQKLKDDKNFNIIKTFIISLDECKEFCEKVAHRQYRKAYWN